MYKTLTHTLFIVLLFASSNLFSQNVISAEDIIPNMGDNWSVGFAYPNTDSFDVNLGVPGENANYDFSEYSDVNDLETAFTMSEINASNASYLVEIVDVNTVNDAPMAFQDADFYLKLTITEDDQFWLVPYKNTGDGLIILGDMIWNENSTPAGWFHTVGYHAGPGRNIPFNLELGTPKTQNWSILTDSWSGGEDSIVVSDIYTFDGEGDFISPQGETYSNVCRLLHKSQVDVYIKYTGVWEHVDTYAEYFISYRKRGSLIPLTEIYVNEDWTTDDNIVSTNELTVDFYFPHFALTDVPYVSRSNNNIKVNPNPARDFVQISWEGNIGETISIEWCDLQGRILPEYSLEIQQSLTNQKVLTPTVTGIYFLKLRTKGEVFTEKVVVE